MTKIITNKHTFGQYVGIDYSMTSPSLTVCPKTKEFKFENCTCFYLSNKKKLVDRLHPNCIGTGIREYTSNEARFDYISRWAVSLLSMQDNVVLEGYAMGAKGQVFTIGENTGVLKYKLYRERIFFDPISPSTIKKFATGKGNAKKDDMYDAFVSETGVKLMDFFPSKTLSSPVSDIVDSFYMAKYSHHKDKGLLDSSSL